MVRTHNRGAHAGKPAPLRGGPARGTRARGARAGDKRTGESRVRGVRPRTTRGRVIAAAGATVVLLVGLALGWASPEPSAEPTVQSFLLAWENGDYASAAALTTGAPAVAVAAAMESAYQQLGAADLSLSMGNIAQRGDTADAHFKASVNLGRGGPPWTYTGNFAVRRVGGGWKVQWVPSVIVPGLRPGLRLAVLSTMPPRAQLLDAEGAPLAPPVPPLPGRRDSQPADRPGADREPAGPGDRAGRRTRSSTGSPRRPSAQFLELLRLSPAHYQTLRAGLSPDARPDHPAGTVAAVQQHRLGGVRLGRHRDGPGAAGGRGAVPARAPRSACPACSRRSSACWSAPPPRRSSRRTRTARS